MNFKKTIITLIILAVLIGIYLIDSAKHRKKETEEAESKNLSTIKSGDISTIKLIRNGETVLFNKDKKTSEWFIELPDEGRCKTDKDAVLYLVEKLGNTEKTESLGKLKNLDKYGLDKPSIEITFSDEKKGQTFRLGKKTPTGDGVYLIKDNDDVVYVANSGIFDASDKKIYDFRDRKLMSFNNEDIFSINLSEDKTTFNFEKDENDKWILEAGKKYIVDGEKIGALLNSLNTAEVKEFLSADKRVDTGLDKPAIILSLKKKDGAVLKLEFGKIKSEKKQEPKKPAKAELQPPQEVETVYARSSALKSDLLVEKSLLTNLKSDLTLWRSKKILDVSFDSINETTIIGPEKRVSFRRKNQSNFEIFEPDKLKASHWECNSVNNRIASLQTIEFIKPSSEILRKAGFNKPYAELSIKTGKNKLNPDIKEEKTFTVLIGSAIKKDDKASRYAKVSGKEEELYLVTEDSLKEVIKTPFDLREKELINAKSDEVEKISIRTKVGKKDTDIILEEDDGKWGVQDPKELRDKDADDILWNVLGLRMDGTAVKPESLTDYGLEPPFAKVILTLKNNKSITISIGNLIPGDNSNQNYLLIKGEETIYIVSSTLRDSINGLRQP